MKIKYKTPVKPAFDLVTSYVGPRVGIELEYEGVDKSCINYDALCKFWDTTIDHSLRTGGLEFVSRPLPEKKLTQALLTVKRELINSGARVTKRCGVHVHLNVSDLTFGELWNVIALYTVVEPFIFKEFADGREDSHFCVPLWANTAVQHLLWNDSTKLIRGVEKRAIGNLMLLAVPGSPNGHMIKTRVPLTMLANPKYSAMNLQSLMKYGTLEFRQLYGTTDMRKVKKWCLFLINLREHALQYPNACTIVNTVLQEGYAAVLPELGLEERPDVSPDYIEDAIDAACLISGHNPTNPNVFTWEI